MTKTAITASIGRFNMIFTGVTLIICYAFLMLLITDAKEYQRAVESEVLFTVGSLTASESEYILQKTRQRQQKWIYDSGFYPSLKKMFLPKEVPYIEELTKGVFSTKWNYRALMNVQYLAYQLIHRLTMLQFWLMTLLPLMAAIVITGFYQWRIKQYQLGGHSVSVVRIWTKAIWVVFAVLATYLVVPNVGGAYSLFAPPIVLVFAAVGVGQIIKSFNKYN